MHLGAHFRCLLGQASLSLLLPMFLFLILLSKNQLSGQGSQMNIYNLVFTCYEYIYIVKLISGSVDFFRILSKYGVHGFPTLFLLNSRMRVRYHGNRSFESLAAFYSDVAGKAFVLQLLSFCDHGDQYYFELIYLVVCFGKWHTFICCFSFFILCFVYFIVFGS